MEVCAHTSANKIPPDFTLLKVVSTGGRVLSVGKSLPEDWAVNIQFSRDFGTAWLRQKQSVLLKVPCAMVPETFNFLLNPLHPDAKRVVISVVYSYPFDARLKK